MTKRPSPKDAADRVLNGPWQEAGLDFLQAPADDDALPEGTLAYALTPRRTDLGLLREIEAASPFRPRAAQVELGHMRLEHHGYIRLDGLDMHITDRGREVVRMNTSVRIGRDPVEWPEAGANDLVDRMQDAELRKAARSLGLDDELPPPEGE